MAAALSKLRSADSAYAQTAMATARATFVIDFFVRKIFGWRVSNSMTASFAPDAFKPAICRRRSVQDGVIPTPGPQHAALFIRCSERRVDFGIDTSARGKPSAKPNGKPQADALERRTATPCWPPAA